MTALQAVVVASVVLARLLAPLAIPRRPVPGLLASLVLDAVDDTVFTATGAGFEDYQSYDKALDVYYLAIAYASTLRNWPSGLAFQAARLLWYWRLVGVVAFELSGARWLLLVFPNVFEYFFLAYELVRLRWDPRRLTNRQVVALVVGLWLLVKLPQEWWIHVAMLDLTDQAGSRPLIAALVVLLALAAVAVAACCVRWWGPPPDWCLATVVDRHLPRPGTVAPVALGLGTRRFAARLGEKVLLVTLVVVVFAEVVPDRRATVTQLVAATVVVVVANGLVSQAFARAGTRWRSTLSQFVVMGLVNVAIVGVLRQLPEAGGASFDTGASLFFGLLLTLLVTLVDRYRTVRRARWDPPSAVLAHR